MINRLRYRHNLFLVRAWCMEHVQ